MPRPTLAGALLLLAGAVTPVLQAPPAHAAQPGSGPGHVEVLHLPSGDEQGTRDVWAYRPAVPDSSALPVLWFLHGFPGTGDDPFQVGLADAADRYIAGGGTPFVIAAPDGNGSTHSDTEFADAVDGTDRVESFIVHTAIPAVEGDHPRDRVHRAIAGFSMGGFGAMNLALRHTDLFGQAAPMSGYFHVDDPDGVFGGRPDVLAANSPDQHLDAARSLHIDLFEAADDTRPLTEHETDRYKGLLDGAGVPAVVTKGTGNHTWAYAASQFPALFSFLDGQWHCVFPDVVGAPSPASGRGYWVLGGDGGVFAFDAPYRGGLVSAGVHERPVALAGTPSGNGYWVTAGRGGVFAFGDAPFLGSEGAARLNQPVVGMTPTPSGRGYWLVAADGGIFTFGDAPFLGSTGGTRLNQPIVGMAATPSGQGYWLVASDGGVFAYGDAPFLGSMGGARLNRPVLGMASDPSSRGYWLVAADGGLFAFGAAYHGSLPGAVPCDNPGALALRSSATGAGYWILGADAGVFSFGDAAFHGSFPHPIGGVVDLAVRP
jgi:S-formylglutathione hydrolase FrmB